MNLPHILACLLWWALAVPALAAPSLCAHLPEAGPVASPGPAETQPPRPRADRSLLCPPGWRLDVAARVPACTRTATRAVEGNPRAACRGTLGLGPVAPLPPQWRPTRSCPGGAITALLPLEGVNAGLADVMVRSLVPGVTVTDVDDDTAGLAPAERPSARGCFAHACRLVKIAISHDAPDEIRLELRVADGASTAVHIPVITHCPDPIGPR